MNNWTLGELAVALSIVFILHAFVVVPWLQRRLAAAANNSKPKWAIAVLVLETTKLMSLAALISAGFIWAIMLWLITFDVGASSVSVSHVIDRVQAVHDLIQETKFGLWLVAFLLALVALINWIMRRRRSQFAHARARLLQDNFSELFEKLKRGELPPLEPTPEMATRINEIETLDAQIQQVKEQEAAVQSDDERKKLSLKSENLLNDRGAILQELVTLDILRRVKEPEYDPDLVGLPPPARTFTQKLGRIFVSRGMFRQLGLGQRALLLLNILLAIPSLLVLSGNALTVDLDARITRLDQLRVGLVAQEARGRFEAATKITAPAPQQSDAVDDQTYTHIAYAHANAFENAIARNVERIFPSDVQAPPSRNVETVLREQDARRRILSSFSTQANGPHSSGPLAPPRERVVDVHGLATGSIIEERPAIGIPGHRVELDELAHRAAALAVDPAPRALTPAGESLAREIIASGRQDPSFRERIVRAYRATGASFFEAARPSQLRAVMLAGALGGSDTAVIGHTFSEPAAQWANGAIEAIEPGFRARTYQTYSRNYLAALFETGQVGEAIKAVEVVPDFNFLRTERATVRTNLASHMSSDAEIVGRLQRFPVGLVEIHDGVTNSATEDAALTRYYKGANVAQHANLSEARLGELIASAPSRARFESYFPSDSAVPAAMEARTATAAGGAGASGGGGFSSGGSPGKPNRATRVSTSAAAGTRVAEVTRARSFFRLRGFARVGGVVIGRDPDGENSLDIRKLEWQQTGRTTRLTLTDGRGRQIVFEPFESSIVQLALAYAADGRVLTATMTNAEPLRELRIMVHPVLVDTPIGCRAIDIDRFVDETVPSQEKASEKIAPRGLQSRLVTYQQSAYAAARAALLQAALDDPATRVELGNRDGLVQYLRASISDEASRYVPLTDVVRVLPEQLLSPTYSPLKVKKNYYDQRIVKLIETCAIADGSEESFKACLNAEAKKLVAAPRMLTSGNINWTAPTPRFEIWSGVRELPYRLDDEFMFAGRSKAPELPMPFQFMIQVSFTSYPNAGSATPWYEIKDETADDIDPWLFPDPQVPITESVTAAVQSDMVKRETFEAMRKFVWVERLFRAGLSGRLGRDFPVERLGDLADATAGFVLRQRTYRWNVRMAPELPFLFRLAKASKQLKDDGTRQAAACMRSVGIDLSATGVTNEIAISTAVSDALPRLYSVSDDEWDRLCRFSESAATPDIAADSVDASNMRRLRQVYGLREEEELSRNYRGCGAL